ncbi:MAG: hypothetical protein JSR67_12490 [Proteobacteria bacterium]|nr:hypothetical protein [Pseudomonadota bacterium]
MRGLRLKAGAAFAVAVLAAAVVQAAEKPKPPTVSEAMTKPLVEVQGLLKDSKFPEAIAKLNAANALPGKSPYDQHVINQDLLVACSKTNDSACLGKVLGEMVDDSYTSTEDKQRFTRFLAGLAYQAKDYGKAVDYGNSAIKGGFATDELYTTVAASYYLKNDFANATQLEDAHIADLAKQGKKPSNDDVNVYLSSCAKSQDQACIAKALRYQLTYYPKPEAWGQAIAQVRPKGDVETLQTYRLMLDTGAMNSADEYLDMARVALGRGSPGDAKKALQAGTDAGQLSNAKAGDLHTLTASATKAAAADQSGLARSEQEANASASGLKNAGVGLAYLGYGEFDKAADQLGKAVSKGGLKNEADTRLSLGIAQLKSGHKSDAIATFQSVKGSAVLEQLASLWAIHAGQT